MHVKMGDKSEVVHLHYCEGDEKVISCVDEMCALN